MDETPSTKQPEKTTLPPEAKVEGKVAPKAVPVSETERAVGEARNAVESSQKELSTAQARSLEAQERAEEEEQVNRDIRWEWIPYLSNQKPFYVFEPQESKNSVELSPQQKSEQAEQTQEQTQEKYAESLQKLHKAEIADSVDKNIIDPGIEARKKAWEQMLEERFHEIFPWVKEAVLAIPKTGVTSEDMDSYIQWAVKNSQNVFDALEAWRNNPKTWKDEFTKFWTLEVQSAQNDTKTQMEAMMNMIWSLGNSEEAKSLREKIDAMIATSQEYSKPDNISKAVWIFEEFIWEDKLQAAITKNITEKWLLIAGIDPEKEWLGTEITKKQIETLKQYVKDVGGENFDLDQLPVDIRQRFIFEYGEDGSTFSKTILSQLQGNEKFFIDRAVQAAKKGIFQKRVGENDDDYKKRVPDDVKKTTGLSIEEVAQHGKLDPSQWNPLFRLLVDLLAPFWAFMTWKVGDFWRNYMEYKKGSKDNEDRDQQKRWDEIQKNYYANESGWLAPELADLGFKGDVIQSIWNWEYQPWENYKAHVVPAGKSGLTLCGGIDLAYTPFEKVKSFFAGILDEKTIQQLQPFCENSGKRWPIRDVADAKWKQSGLKSQVSQQLSVDNMKIAFTRSLASDWEDLVKKHPSEVLKAPGYMQSIMLSRFYHQGAGWSNSIIKKMIAANFKQQEVIDILRNHKKSVSQGWYKNRLDNEIRYVQAAPPDAQLQIPQLAQNQSRETQEAVPDPAQWFRENAWKPYGGWDDKYDCMTSTHASLRLWKNAESLNSWVFKQSTILRDWKTSDLWNVSTAAARYSWILTTEKLQPKKGIQFMQESKREGVDDADRKWWYGGDLALKPENMEYYIEENVMQRVNGSSNGMIDVGSQWKLIHYSKSKKWVGWIAEDIKSRLQNGEYAMMGATGEGTNIWGHEWLVVREGDQLMVYDATWYKGQGVAGEGMPLEEYLNQKDRRGKYPNEAIIFAKWQQTPMLAAR